VSRGPGKWQRAVLEACEAAVDTDTGWTTWVSVDEVASRCGHSTLTPSERECIRRAMRTLGRQGRIEADTRWTQNTERIVRRDVPAQIRAAPKSVREFAKWLQTQSEGNLGASLTSKYLLMPDLIEREGYTFEYRMSPWVLHARLPAPEDQREKEVVRMEDIRAEIQAIVQRRHLPQ
jgi:hypothetical protein